MESGYIDRCVSLLVGGDSKQAAAYEVSADIGFTGRPHNIGHSEFLLIRTN